MNDENSTPAALRRLNASPAASQLMLNLGYTQNLLNERYRLWVLKKSLKSAAEI
jgi:hypothetical protein